MSSNPPANLLDVLRTTLAIIQQTSELPQDSPASQDLRRSIVRAIGAISMLKNGEIRRERKQPPAIPHRLKMRAKRVHIPFSPVAGGAAKSGLRLHLVWSGGGLRGSVGEPLAFPRAMRPDVEG